MLLAAAFLAIRGYSDLKSLHRNPEVAFKTIDDAFRVRRDQGWTVTSAPTDRRRYRVCGATESDPQSGLKSLNGSFTASGKTIEVNVPVPDGMTVAVEGLEPLEGGPLTYAVLTRHMPE